MTTSGTRQECKDIETKAIAVFQEEEYQPEAGDEIEVDGEKGIVV